MPEPQPETWRTDPRERLLTAIDRTWARGVLGVTPEQLVDGFAHQLAEQQRAHGNAEDGEPGCWHDGVTAAADLIDPESQR